MLAGLGGTKTFELYGSPQTKEGSVKGGKTGGRKNVESGWASQLGKKYGGLVCAHLENFRTPERQKERAKKGGQRAAEVNVKSGWADKLGRIYGPINARKIPLEVKIQGFMKGRHIRWHVKRNIVNPKCSLCVVSNG